MFWWTLTFIGYRNLTVTLRARPLANTFTPLSKSSHSVPDSLPPQIPTDAIMPHFPEPSLPPAQGLVSDPPPAPHLPPPLADNQVAPVMSGFLPPAPPSQVCSADLVTPPQVGSHHLLSPPLHHLYNRGYDTGFYEPEWRATEEPASFTFTCQVNEMKLMILNEWVAVQDGSQRCFDWFVALWVDSH